MVRGALLAGRSGRAGKAARRTNRRARRTGVRLLVAAALASAVALVATALLVFGGAAEAGLWWLLNDQAPSIEASVPPGPQRGQLTVPVTVRPAGRAALATVTVDGRALVGVPGQRVGPAPAAQAEPALAAQPIAAGGAGDELRWWLSEWRLTLSGSEPRRAATASVPLVIDTAALADGRHILRLEAVDRSRRHNRTVLEAALTTDNTPPQLTLATEPPRLRAGRAALLRLGANEEAELRVTWGGEALPLLAPAGSLAGVTSGPGGAGTAGTAGTAGAIGGAGTVSAAGASGPAGASGADAATGAPPSVVALVAVPVDGSAHDVPVHLAGRDAAGNVAEAAVVLPVEPVTSPRQVLDVPPSLAALATGPVATAEAAQVASLTRAVRPQKLWRGEFRAPFWPSFRRTTGFGDRRDYADGHVAYHSGYDIAAPLGMAVPAAAEGVVVFAGQLSQRGSTVVLDHGWGVYTLYAHLSRLDVQPGQAVTQGEPVGLVGSTGLSTGPHLHWEVRLRGLPVDPAAWIALSGQVP